MIVIDAFVAVHIDVPIVFDFVSYYLLQFIAYHDVVDVDEDLMVLVFDFCICFVNSCPFIAICG